MVTGTRVKWLTKVVVVDWFVRRRFCSDCSHAGLGSMRCGAACDVSMPKVLPGRRLKRRSGTSEDPCK